eukprot:scaffold5337_cov167-Amphora_coffeaeformis.AAC.3
MPAILGKFVSFTFGGKFRICESGKHLSLQHFVGAGTNLLANFAFPKFVSSRKIGMRCHKFVKNS